MLRTDNAGEALRTITLQNTFKKYFSTTSTDSDLPQSYLQFYVTFGPAKLRCLKAYSGHTQIHSRTNSQKLTDMPSFMYTITELQCY